jgi:DNA-binding NarL/FixJ family response regulator
VNETPTSNGTSAGVLICDDHAQIRKLLNAIISTSPGLRVVGEAADGNEAIEKGELLQPEVILLDLVMPNHNGLDSLPKLRRVCPQARILVFSAFADDLVAEQVIALGAVGYLEKGAAPATLLATIHQALQQTLNGADAGPSKPASRTSSLRTRAGRFP